MMQKIRIGDKLVQYGYITEEQLQKALSLQRGTGKRVGEILIGQGLITAELLTNVLTEILKVDTIDLSPSNIRPEAVKKIPKNICKRYKVFPYKIDEKNYI